MTGLVLKVRTVSWLALGILLISTTGCSGPANLYASLASTAGTTAVSTITGALASQIANRIIGG